LNCQLKGETTKHWKGLTSNRPSNLTAQIDSQKIPNRIPIVGCQIKSINCILCLLQCGLYLCVKNHSPVLMWTDRQRILKDVASGLQFLHTVDTNPLVHGDVKR